MSPTADGASILSLIRSAYYGAVAGCSHHNQNIVFSARCVELHNKVTSMTAVGGISTIIPIVLNEIFEEWLDTQNPSQKLEEPSW